MQSNFSYNDSMWCVTESNVLQRVGKGQGSLKNRCVVGLFFPSLNSMFIVKRKCDTSVGRFFSLVHRIKFAYSKLREISAFDSSEFLRH